MNYMRITRYIRRYSTILEQDVVNIVPEFFNKNYNYYSMASTSCVFCNNLGYIKCNNIDNNINNKSSKKIKCSQCNGTGWIICPFCNPS